METFNIIGIDPGNNFGIAIFTIDVSSYRIVNITTEFFVLEHYISMYTQDKVMNKLEYISYIAKYLVDRYNPVAISIESAFMNSRFPKAVINLSQYVGMLEYSIIKYNSFIHVFKYMPKYVKAKVSFGTANKNDVLTGIHHIPEVIKLVNTNILTEHEIDAIAIAYTLLDEIRSYPLVLCAI